MPGSAGALEARVAAVRHFNRFYTRQIGVLQDGLLQTSVLAHRGARAL